MSNDKIDRVVEEITEVKVSMARIATTLELALRDHSKKLDDQSNRLEALEKQMETALLPIKVGKAIVVVVTSLSALAGSIYGFVQFIKGGPSS